jgi:retron-type reverse transcriptase
MKTHKNLFGRVCELENLYKAYLKARKGKNDMAEVIRFTYYLEHELIKLHEQLIDGTYNMGRYRNFKVHEPKERLISALPFRDRVVHHAIHSVIEPIFDKIFIYDSYACRTGKGTHNGMERLRIFMGKRKNRYALKCDISKYFQSVDHSALKSMIRRKISDDNLLELLDRIIDSVPKGIPIGNLTSQLFANVCLNDLDYFVKHELRMKCYVRYMDDFIILHESKQELHIIKMKIKSHLHEIGLELHRKKAIVFPATLGVDFLGYRIFADYRLARKSTLKRFLRRVKTKIRKYGCEKIEFEKLMESFNSWNAYMDHADTHNLKMSLYSNYFKNIM